MARQIVSKVPSLSLVQTEKLQENLKNSTEDKLIRSLDRLINTISKNSLTLEKQDLTFKDIIKNSLKQRALDIKDNFVQSLRPTNIIRKTLNPSEGGIVDNIISSLENRNQLRKEEKENKSQFIQNYLENTDKGKRLFKQDPVKAKEQAEKIYSTDKAVKAEIARLSGIIENKNNLKNKTGFGGASSSDVAKLEKLEQAHEQFLKKASGIFSKASSEKTDKQPKGGADDKQEAREDQLEMDKLNEEIVKLLSLIEENTRTKETSSSGNIIAGIKKPTGMFSGVLESLLGGGLLKTIGSLFASALTSIFSLKNILFFLNKLALPLMIITALGNGIKDAFEEFQKSGSITDTIIAGLGGILEVVSFGLLDKDAVITAIEGIKKGIDLVIEGFTKYVITPLMDYVINPLKKFFTDISKAFENLKQNFQIPKFTIPNPVGSDWEFGPFKPFAEESVIKTANKNVKFETPVPLATKSTTAIEKALLRTPELKPVPTQNNVVTNAPVNVNNRTSITQKPIVRNPAIVYPK